MYLERVVGVCNHRGVDERACFKGARQVGDQPFAYLLLADAPKASLTAFRQENKKKWLRFCEEDRFASRLQLLRTAVHNNSHLVGRLVFILPASRLGGGEGRRSRPMTYVFLLP